MNQKDFDLLIHKVSTKKNIYGAVFYVSTDNKDLDLISASGEFEVDSRYYIASINKLFISTVVLRLFYSGRIDIKDKISQYLPSDLATGLHVYKGVDYSNQLTIEHLLSLTSGLPCYISDKQSNNKTVMEELEQGFDQPWATDKVFSVVKTMHPHFAPSNNEKAKYGDTNHQILSRIVENIFQDSIKHILTDLFKELGMSNTFVFEKILEKNFVPLRYKAEILNIPEFLASTQNDIISTAKDQMIFIKAFFQGYFFPKDKLKELKVWKNIFFPFKYGIGLQKFYLPRVLNSFRTTPEILGHCGSVGSIAFYVPEKKLYITGTTNQQAKPQVAFQTLIKIVNRINNEYNNVSFPKN